MEKSVKGEEELITCPGTGEQVVVVTGYKGCSLGPCQNSDCAYANPPTEQPENHPLDPLNFYKWLVTDRKEVEELSISMSQSPCLYRLYQ